MENRMNEIAGEYPFNLLLAAKGDATLDLPLKLTADILAGVQYSLSTLSEQEQTVLHRRYIACDSISDIASRFSVTEECIRRIERKALFKLREPSRWNYILLGVAVRTGQLRNTTRGTVKAIGTDTDMGEPMPRTMLHFPMARRICCHNLSNI